MANVLLIRLDGIGDAVVLAPLFAALREQGHAIGVVSSERNAGLFTRRAVDREHVMAYYDEHAPNARDVAAVAAEIRAAAYDVAVIPTEDARGYRLARGVARRVGFHNGLEKPFKTLWVRSICSDTVFRPASLARSGPHEVEVLMRLLAPLGITQPPTRDATLLGPLLLERAPETTAGSAIQIAEKWRTVGLDDAALAAVIRQWNAAGGLRGIAAPAESEYATEIARRSGLDIAITPTLDAWKSAIASAALLMTPDSGAAHIAGMIGVPVVDVFADDGRFASQRSRWRPWASRAECITLGSVPSEERARLVLNAAALVTASL